MKYRLLVDSNEYWEQLQSDISKSNHHFYMAALSFEGDATGKKLADALYGSPCEDRRIMIDDFTRFVISDRFIYNPCNYFSRKVNAERRETTRLIRDLKINGVRVMFTNPMGPMGKNCAGRNHKKMVVIDDSVSYIGGINISDHNFDWHDMMIRVEDERFAKLLKADFLENWKGQKRPRSEKIDDLWLHVLDGHSNHRSFQSLFRIMENAEKRILIESPYLMFPFIEKLGDLRQKGIQVVVICPEKNNRQVFDHYIRRECVRRGFDLKLFSRGMTHLKLMMIDDDYLVCGSTNFDYVSYTAQQEIFAIISNKKLIHEVKNRIVEADLAGSCPFDHRYSKFRGFTSKQFLNGLCKSAVKLNTL